MSYSKATPSRDDTTSVESLRYYTYVILLLAIVDWYFFIEMLFYIYLINKHLETISSIAKPMIKAVGLNRM